MKIKVDDVVKKEFAKSGKTIISTAEDIGISRVQLSKILKEPEMEMKYVLAIGKSIRFDFSKYFPILNTEKLEHMVNDPAVPYESMGNAELRNVVIETQAKYIMLLEEHVKVLHELKENRN
ncbi:hypothetical protein [Pedobacter sp. Leaf250]|uniref:hypothetical protein n=1 Tax=Pedobacter sp. Leaf250 TaxID=2876559 RepID=UPI001E37AA8D|nr:hypothetical protein [Pedobacter sp. Leaf250]